MIKSYYQQSLDTISTFNGKKPSLLLHSCCAPCNCYVMEWLLDKFEVTLYFNNSNIYPKEEYIKRLEELKNYVQVFNERYHSQIKLIVNPYNPEHFHSYLEKRKDDLEYQQRCFMCYSLRMKEAFDYADLNQFDYFTTVMTISRHKNANKLNEIGNRLSSAYKHTQYFYSDFKKGKGQEKSIALSKELNLYRQQYCGCKYSYQEYLERQKNKLD